MIITYNNIITITCENSNCSAYTKDSSSTRITLIATVWRYFSVPFPLVKVKVKLKSEAFRINVNISVFTFHPSGVSGWWPWWISAPSSFCRTRGRGTQWAVQEFPAPSRPRSWLASARTLVESANQKMSCCWLQTGTRDAPPTGSLECESDCSCSPQPLSPKMEARSPPQPEWNG